MSEYLSISKPALSRIIQYLSYLRSSTSPSTSAAMIAEELGLNPVLVRKDIAQVSSRGKPRVGYIRSELICDIETFLGYNDVRTAVLVGAGHLGKALLASDLFSDHGLEIALGFDSNPDVCDGRRVLPLGRFSDLCKRLEIHIGIITVPAVAAQEVCDLMIESGIRAIWNFAAVKLNVPDHVVVKNEDMAASLAILANELAKI